MAHSPARRRVARTLASLTLLGAVTVTGCKKYYRVTDSETGELYYTDYINKRNESQSGVLQFVDESTGAVIRLEEYEYRKIGRRAFRRGIGESEGE